MKLSLTKTVCHVHVHLYIITERLQSTTQHLGERGEVRHTERETENRDRAIQKETKTERDTERRRNKERDSHLLTFMSVVFSLTSKTRRMIPPGPDDDYVISYLSFSESRSFVPGIGRLGIAFRRLSKELSGEKAKLAAEFLFGKAAARDWMRVAETVAFPCGKLSD